MRIFLPFLAQTWQHALWTPCHGPEVAGRKQPAWGRETGTYKVTEQISICTKDNGANISLLKTRLKNIEKGQLERNLECWTGNGLSVWTFEYQFSSVAQPCPTLCEPMDCSTPGLPVHHQPLELTQTHVHWIGDAIQPSQPLSPSSPLAFNLSQWESQFLGKLIGSLGVPKERGVWNSQGGRKDKLFFSPHSLGLYNNNVSCLRTVFGFNLLLS